MTLSLAIFACNLPTSAPPTAPIVPTMTAGIVYQPTFAPASCAFQVPSDYNPECGYLIVPENRARVDSPLIRLHVAIFRSGTPVADPVVHLAGGPGSSSLSVAEYMFAQGLGAILNQRDFILFDQRGTGFSQPRLDCPERSSITGILLEQGLAAPGNDQIILDAFRRCRDRLVGQGIDLTAYHSAASAADLNDLRIVLGYDKLNLYAVSYGTRLALTLIRDHPEAVRSAVLDSVYPLQVNLYTALAPNAERAFNAFFNNCSADVTCSASYPDLRASFYQLVDQLNASPVSVSLYAGGAEHTVRVDGALLMDVLFVGLYNPAVTASMPKMIFDISQGNHDILRERLTLYFDTASALGMQMSVQCVEEIPFNAAEEAFVAAQGVSPQIAAFYPVSVQPLFAVCKEWTSFVPDPRENLPVTSDIPALMLAGDHDPITPPDWGRMVGQNLSHSYFHEFPSHGHWVTRSSDCALSMSLAFWNDPTQDPGYFCQ
ncbi:MAG TPA: alpha/beta fold hydrolase [Anaerolineales bacterium]|nr:alpha/beta fold hydrolase [Anaerolineales bacterium]